MAIPLDSRLRGNDGVMDTCLRRYDGNSPRRVDMRQRIHHDFGTDHGALRFSIDALRPSAHPVIIHHRGTEVSELKTVFFLEMFVICIIRFQLLS